MKVKKSNRGFIQSIQRGFHGNLGLNISIQPNLVLRGNNIKIQWVRGRWLKIVCEPLL